MQPKKYPQRKCVGCGEVRNKNELIRVLRSPEGVISIDFKGKKSGRGAYICHDAACLKKAARAKKLERSLETEISPEVMAELEKIVLQTEKNVQKDDK